MNIDIKDVTDLEKALRGKGVRRVKFGDVEIEWFPDGAAPATKARKTEPEAEFPPDLQEPTTEELALWSSGIAPNKK